MLHAYSAEDRRALEKQSDEMLKSSQGAEADAWNFTTAGQQSSPRPSDSTSIVKEENPMKTRMQILAAFIGLLFGASFAARATQQSANSNSQSHGQMSGNHSKMMKSCQDNMQSMMQSNDKVKATIEDAKKSNDPAKMRAALDDAEKSIDRMNQHMNSCMTMMNMMPGMHGMGMSDHMKGMSGQQKPESSPSSTPPK